MYSAINYLKLFFTNNNISSTKGKKEHKTPSDKMICIICNEQDRNCILELCKHVILCETCAKKLNRCPHCDANINSICKVFI